MRGEHVAHFRPGLKAMFRFVLHGAGQNFFNLARQRRTNLTRPWVLGEVKDQKRIILRIGSGQQMKHRRAQAVNVHARIGLAAEQLRRRIAHGAHRRDALLFFIDPARNAKVD